MADIHIERDHRLGLTEARKIAAQWAEQVKAEFDMACTCEESKTGDQVSFKRSGVHGTLAVMEDRFVLNVSLGFLLGMFKDKIEGEIAKNLDTLMAAIPADNRKNSA